MADLAKRVEGIFFNWLLTPLEREKEEGGARVDEEEEPKVEADVG